LLVELLFGTTTQEDRTLSDIMVTRLLFAVLFGVLLGYVFAIYRRRRADAQMGRCRLSPDWFLFEVVRPGDNGLDGLVFSVARKPGLEPSARLVESRLDHVAHFEGKKFVAADGAMQYFRRRVTIEGLLLPGHARSEMHPLEPDVLKSIQAHIGTWQLGKQVLG